MKKVKLGDHLQPEKKGNNLAELIMEQPAKYD